jgi:hypothetical protein
MSSEEESSEGEKCVLCDARGYDFNNTPCCYERLCEDCEEEMMLYVCSNDSCSKNCNDDRWCIVCFDINGVSNRCSKKGCNYTWCDDCPETHACNILSSN